MFGMFVFGKFKVIIWTYCLKYSNMSKERLKNAAQAYDKNLYGDWEA